MKNEVKKYKPQVIMAQIWYVSNNYIYGQSLKEIKYLLPTHFSHYYNMLPKRTSRPAGHLSVVIIAHITSLKSLTRETDTSEKVFFR